MDQEREDTQLGVVVDITERLEDDHLAREHGLVKVSAYVRDEQAAKKRTAVAERVKKSREKKREAGLVQAYLPAEVAEAIKAGGWDAWIAAQKTEKRVEVPVEVVREVEKVVEVRVEVPKALSEDEQYALEAGQALLKLVETGGFRAFLLRMICR